ncbi:MAG TPA: LamG domain-containing protein, partial [Segetibacter sp.]
MKSKFYSLLLSLLISFTSFAQNTALAFDGADDYATLPSGIVQSISGDFTIETWVYWKGGGDWQRIFDFGNNTSNFMFLTPKSGAGLNTIRFAIGVGGVNEYLETPFLPINQWYHVAVTVNNASNTGRLYVNGVLKNTRSITFRPSNLGNTTINWLGRSIFGSPSPDPYLNGNLDEFRIWSVERTQTQIKQNMFG